MWLIQTRDSISSVELYSLFAIAAKHYTMEAALPTRVDHPYANASVFSDAKLLDTLMISYQLRCRLIIHIHLPLHIYIYIATIARAYTDLPVFENDARAL